MNIKVYDDEQTLDFQVAKVTYDFVKENPQATLCLAAGDTPLGAFKKLTEMPQAREVFADCVFIGLDEWVGLGGNDPGSCLSTMNEHLFFPLGLKEEQKYFFNGKAPDLKKECVRMNEVVEKRGGIDLMVLGIGMNGHLGFNEPGTPFNTGIHVVTLSENSKIVGQKYFNKKMELAYGITLGFIQIKEARQVILMAKGKKKKDIMAKTLNEGVTPMVPATFLQDHQNAIAMLEQSVVG